MNGSKKNRNQERKETKMGAHPKPCALDEQRSKSGHTITYMIQIWSSLIEGAIDFLAFKNSDKDGR
jgi:hypothetical protein